MVIGKFWQFASVLVFLLFVSTSVVLTDTPACDSKDQHCLASQKAHELNQKNLGRELNSRDRLDRTKDTLRTKQERSDVDRHWDHQQAKFEVQTNRDSRRLYDRVRDVKRSVLEQKNLERTRESKRSRADRRYVGGDRYSDLHSSEIENSERIENPETLRDRLSHRFALSATEDGYGTARATRRFSFFRDEAQKPRIMTRFERLQKFRLRHLSHDGTENDGIRIPTRFERIRKDRLSRLSKGDSETSSETDRLEPRHFRNLNKMRESLDRKESSFDRRNAYAAQVRNQVRIAGDAIRSEQTEPRFEVQRKTRQELETELQKENVQGMKNEEQETFMENRRMRKEERRAMEERRIQEEKQRIYEEERKVREEQQRLRDREQRLLETERKVQEIVRQIHEKERLEREERQKKLNEDQGRRTSTAEREDDKGIEQRERLNVFSSEERIKDDMDEWINRQYEAHEHEEERKMHDFDYDEEDNDWDYSDYSDSDSSESYEDEYGIRRRLRDDIRHFPDIERQVRDNVQLYGKEYLDARESFSDEIKDYEDREDIRKHSENREENKFRKERREVNVNERNSRRKRSFDENSDSFRFRHSERRESEGNRQIAEKRSFRSQNERHSRRVNLRNNEQNTRRTAITHSSDNRINVENLQRITIRDAFMETERQVRANLFRRQQDLRNERRFEESSQRREINLNRKDESQNRLEDAQRREDNTERIGISRVRIVELGRNEKRNIRIDENLDNSSEESLNRRQVSQLNEPKQNDQTDKLMQRQENNFHNSEESRLHKQRERRDNLLIKNNRMNEVSITNLERTSNAEKIARDFRNEVRQQNTKGIMHEFSSLNEHLMKSKKNHQMFATASIFYALQAALMGIVLMKAITQEKLSGNNKFRSNYFFKKLGTVINNVRVF